MIRLATMAIASLFVPVTNGWTRAADLANLKVLYIGSERATVYVDFLKGKVALIEAKSRKDFQPNDAQRFDVVLLDWPQGDETREMRTLKSPLGSRAEWKKPTVLLGSAGLNLAVSWKLKGGSGCTCLDPLAYDLREHELFENPFKIDRNQMIAIPTPEYFRDEIQEKEIKVLPVVNDLKKKWSAGWCTHARDFVNYPDIEFISGGVNHQTPSSAALWRQGNLFHFGFEQSPVEMNKVGQLLLLNSIAYISRFAEDRPIAITPSVFAGPTARSRATLGRWLRDSQFPIDAFKDVVAPGIWETLSKQPDRNDMVKWADDHAKFLRPNRDQLLELDEDLVALGMPFDQPKFFEKVLIDLRSNEKDVATRALRLLKRYVPDGPKLDAADSWAKWWMENQQFAFASDAGDYRWYIDHLAKRRGVPTRDLRGPRRADER